MERLKQSEILAPAGNLDILKQVVNAGADAVYFGGDLFGARAYAKNFSREDAAEGIRYAHFHDAQAYLTVNTLLKNREIEQHLYSYLRDYYEMGLDAVIVQDMAVMQMIRSYFPDMAVHASTQMTIASDLGARFLESLGATRVVTSREMSLAEIRRIKDATNVEIETFVHGALCVCYSGQCLMSSLLGGRSGNRGRCAQPCRLPYEVYEQGKKLEIGGMYPLSPKDLCGIKDLKEMLEAGVYSFKIEGRMKGNQYAANVTSIYRQAMDMLLAGEDLHKMEDVLYQELMQLGNRNGFTNAYFHKQNGKELLSLTTGSHTNEKVERPLFEEQKRKITGSFYASTDAGMMLTVEDGEHQVTKYAEGVEVAKKSPATEEDVQKRLMKTGNTPFVFQALDVQLQGELFLPIKALNQLRRDALEEMESYFHTTRETKLSWKQKETKRPSQTKQPSLCITVTTRAQFDVVKDLPELTLLGISHQLFAEAPEEMRRLAESQPVMLMLPEVLRNRGKKRMDSLLQPEDRMLFAAFCVSSYDGLQYMLDLGVSKDRIVLNHRMYTFSNDALDAFREIGFSHFTAPLELNAQELMHRENCDSTMVLYGYLPLMIMANCSHKNFQGCDQKPVALSLEDRYHKRFPVRNDCSICMNTVYNSLPYEIFHQKELPKFGFEQFRLDFTIENEEETRRVISRYRDPNQIPKEATKGHYKRGVE